MGLLRRKPIDRRSVGAASLILAVAACSTSPPPQPTTTIALLPTTTVAAPTTTVGQLEAPVGTFPIESPQAIVSAFGDFAMTVPGDWVPLARSADDLQDLASNLADHLPGESASVSAAMPKT